jgi:hypothetical protein
MLGSSQEAAWGLWAQLSVGVLAKACARPWVQFPEPKKYDHKKEAAWPRGVSGDVGVGGFGLTSRWLHNNPENLCATVSSVQRTVPLTEICETK